MGLNRYPNRQRIFCLVPSVSSKFIKLTQALHSIRFLLLNFFSAGHSWSGYLPQACSNLLQALPIEASELYEKHMKPARQGWVGWRLTGDGLRKDGTFWITDLAGDWIWLELSLISIERKLKRKRRQGQKAQDDLKDVRQKMTRCERRLSGWKVFVWKFEFVHDFVVYCNIQLLYTVHCINVFCKQDFNLCQLVKCSTRPEGTTLDVKKSPQPQLAQLRVLWLELERCKVSQADWQIFERNAKIQSDWRDGEERSYSCGKGRTEPRLISTAWSTNGHLNFYA